MTITSSGISRKSKGVLARFILFLAIISSIFTNNARANYYLIDFPSNLIKQNNEVRAVSKIYFASVKINNILDFKESSYAKEVAYFFSKNGLEAPPAYILFETGNIYQLNRDWVSHQYSNNENTGVLFVIMAYEDSFEPIKFQSGLSRFRGEIETKLNTLSLESVNSIEIKDFKIEKSEDRSILVFGESEDSRWIQANFEDIDFNNKVEPVVQIKSINIKPKAEPNEILIADIEIYNNTGADLFFSPQYSLMLAFEDNSDFFVNEKWNTQRIARVVDTGLIKNNNSLTIPVEIKAPIFPEMIESELQIEFLDKVLDKKKFSFEVLDVGQKILRIKETELGYLNVRQEPNTVSPEIGRAGAGILFTFTDLENNYYKIDYFGKDAWVSANYVDIIKDE